MLSRRPEFEWCVTDHHEAWPLSPAAHSPEELVRQASWYSRRRARVLWGLAGIVLLVVVGGAVLMHKAEAGLDAVTDEIRQTVYIDEWSAQQSESGPVQQPQHRLSDLSDEVKTDVTAGPLIVAITDIALRNNRLMARVIITQTMPDGNR